jgi:hypothetical protein
MPLCTPNKHTSALSSQWPPSCSCLHTAAKWIQPCFNPSLPAFTCLPAHQPSHYCPSHLVSPSVLIPVRHSPILATFPLLASSSLCAVEERLANVYDVFSLFQRSSPSQRVGSFREGQPGPWGKAEVMATTPHESLALHCSGVSGHTEITPPCAGVPNVAQSPVQKSQSRLQKIERKLGRIGKLPLSREKVERTANVKP